MRLSKECQRQALASTPALFNEFLMGLGYGWVAPTLHRLQNNANSDLPLTTGEASWIASLHELSRLIGPLVITALMKRVGRKGVLAIASIAFFVSFALIAFTRSVTLIYAARVIFGVAVGLHDVSASIYLCENFKPTLRGTFGALSVACFYGGSLAEFCACNYLAYETTAYTNTVAAFVALSAIFYSTETAEYLISKGRYEKALENFLWLRGENFATSDALRQFDNVKRHVEDECARKPTLKASLSVPINRKTIVIVLLFCVLTNATGFESITSYVSIAFIEGTFTQNEYTVLFGALQLFAALLGTTFIERVNRRVILIFTLLISALVHAATAILFYSARNGIIVPYFSFWIFASITTYAMLVSSSILPIFAIVRGELLAQNVRSFGGAIAIVGHSLVGFLTIKAFLLVDQVAGIHWNFVFYSVMSVASVVFVYVTLPETRGQSLIEIQNAIVTRNKK